MNVYNVHVSIRVMIYKIWVFFFGPPVDYSRWFFNGCEPKLQIVHLNQMLHGRRVHQIKKRKIDFCRTFCVFKMTENKTSNQTQRTKEFWFAFIIFIIIHNSIRGQTH